jgi:hypothetical protein
LDTALIKVPKLCDMVRAQCTVDRHQARIVTRRAPPQRFRYQQVHGGPRFHWVQLTGNQAVGNPVETRPVQSDERLARCDPVIGRIKLRAPRRKLREECLKRNLPRLLCSGYTVKIGLDGAAYVLKRSVGVPRTRSRRRA